MLPVISPPCPLCLLASPYSYLLTPARHDRDWCLSRRYAGSFALPLALLSSSGLNRRCVQEDWDGEEIHPIWPPVMDHCEEALDPSCQDLDVIATVLVAIPPPLPRGMRALTRLLHVWGQEEVDDEEFEHPVVDALINKQEALEAYLSGKKQTNEVLTGRADGI